VSQRQIGADLVRLGDQCQDSTVAVRQLTRMEPTVDGTRSLLARLQQTEKELEFGVRSLDAIRGLGQDLAEVRRDLANVSQTTDRIDTLVGELEVGAVRTIGTTQGAMQRLQDLEHLAYEQEALLPTLERSLVSFLTLLRTLEAYDGEVMSADRSLRELLDDQQQVVSLLRRVEGALQALEGLSPDERNATMVAQPPASDRDRSDDSAASDSLVPEQRTAITATSASSSGAAEIEPFAAGDFFSSDFESTRPQVTRSISSRLPFDAHSCEETDSEALSTVPAIGTPRTGSLSSRRAVQQR